MKTIPWIFLKPVVKGFERRLWEQSRYIGDWELSSETKAEIEAMCSALCREHWGKIWNDREKAGYALCAAGNHELYEIEDGVLAFKV